MNKFDEIAEVNTARVVAHNDDFVAEGNDNAALLHETLARTGKSTSAFKTISEVAEELSVQQHVLRFWETKFSQVRPLKRGGGRRYYRPEDVQLLHAIHSLLYTEGYTIKGVQKLLRDMGKKKIVDGFDTSSGTVNAAAEVTPKKSIEANVIASHPAAIASQTVVYAQPSVPSLSPATVNMPQQNKKALTMSQRETLDGLLSELKEIRNLIKEE